MQLDQERIQAILKAPHSFYGHITKRNDNRWYPGIVCLLTQQLTPEMRVLDVGCGDGSILLELSPFFQSGLGIDIDPDHLALAEEALAERRAANVAFRLLDFPHQADQLAPESFDLVYSLRGPVPDSDDCLQAALRLLKRDGMLFCEEIGDRHQPEVGEVFRDLYAGAPGGCDTGRLRSTMERSGIEIRLSADCANKWIYPDVYAWFKYQCNIWTWCGIPLPEPDDPRIAEFARRFSAPTGEIVTTHHVVWVGGVKC